MATGWKITEQQWADIHGRPRDEGRKADAAKNRKKLRQMEQKAMEIISQDEEVTFDEFKKAWKSPPSDKQNVFWWYYRRIRTLSLKTARGYYDSLRWVHHKATRTYPHQFDDIRSLQYLQPAHQLRFRQVTPEWLKSLENEMRQAGRSENTIGIYARNLRAVFNDAIDDGAISQKHYPFSKNSGSRRYSPPSGRKKPKALTRAQLGRMINTSKKTPTERWAVDMFLFAYLAGGQDFGDYFRLKWKDRRYDNRIGRYKAVIDRTKTKKTKRSGAPVVIIFNPVCENIMQRYSLSENPDDYIFPVLKPGMDEEQKAKKVHNAIGTINRALKRVARRCGVPTEISTRWARHSHASALASNPNLTIYDIQEQLGHSSPKTTERYIKSLTSESSILDALDGLMPDKEDGQPGEAM